MTKKRIRLIYGILSGVALGIAGLLIIAASLRIYRGDYAADGQLYSPAAVSAAFQPIAVAVYVALALLIGGFILSMIFPPEPKKLKAEKQYDTILAKLRNRYSPESCDPAVRQEIEAQQKKRKQLRVICCGILGVCSVIFLSYGLNIRNFPLEDATGSMQKAMWVFLPCLCVPFGFAIFAHYAHKRSLQAEIELVKTAVSQGAAAAVPTEKTVNKCCPNTLNIVKGAILGAAVLMMIYGILFGGTKDVLTKAINLCTECVGLG